MDGRLAMRKNRFSMARPVRSLPLLISVVLASACQSESNDSQTALAGGPSADPVSLFTDELAGVGSASDLSGDALTPPEQPRLAISSDTATLILDWSPAAEHTRARLYHHDSALTGETLVHESDDMQQHLLHLPSATPQRAWHREQYRLELCTPDDCTSSERMSLSGLAASSAHYLAPAVYLRGERYADHLTLNRDASLAVISMPVEGALEFHVRSGSRWSLTQRLRLDALPESSARRLLLSASDSGNTIAVYSRDPDSNGNDEIRILERLGEAWFQTSRMMITDPGTTAPTSETADGATASGHDQRPHSLQLSANGTGLLLQSNGLLHTSRRTESGWTSPQLLVDQGSDDGSAASLSGAVSVSSTSNADFTRILSLVQQDSASHVELRTAEQGSGLWQLRARIPLSDFSSDHEIFMRSNASGDELLIAGWEAGDRTERYPILWRYSVIFDTAPSDSPNSVTLQANSSLRATPTVHAGATLAFNANDSLDMAVLGWQLAEDPTSGTLPDAAVSTWKYHQPGQWLTALELPEAIPVLAKQAFADDVFLSADGSTLMLVSRVRRTLSTGNDIAEVMVLR